MQVTTGKYKGKKINSVKGDKIRPSTSRVKESIINILLNNQKFYINGHPALIGGTFADICCGSGSVSLFALSHGATYACLVDNSSYHLKIARENLSIAKEQCKFILCDANDLVQNRDTEFDIIFVDPPYYKNSIMQILSELRHKSWIHIHSIIIVEMSSKDYQAYDAINNQTEYNLMLEKKYGKSRILFLQPIHLE